jgi:hypothetical protein
MDDNVAGRRDGEITLPPPLYLIQLGSISDGKQFSSLPITMTACCRGTHATIIHTFFEKRCKKRRVRRELLASSFQLPATSFQLPTVFPTSLVISQLAAGSWKLEA